MAAAPTMPAPSSRPARRRATESERVDLSVMSSDPEKGHPQDKGDEERQTRIHERPRAEVGIDPDADQEPASEEGHHDSDDRTQHPGGEERADDVDLRSHRIMPRPA